MEKVEISCVVPAYENLALLSRCLMSILTQQSIKSQVIVCDDSKSESVANFVEMLSSYFPEIVYVKGPRTGNAVENWNRGLKKAIGEYCIVVHHDEFLINDKYLRYAIDRLNNKQLDAYVVSPFIVGIQRTSRFHFIQKAMFFLGRPAWMLLAFNWIGPTAVIVFKNKAGLKFNQKLKYLVDVDFYYRLLSSSSRYEFSDEISVVSIGHHSNQITSTYDFLSENKKEVLYLSSLYGIINNKYKHTFLIGYAYIKALFGRR